MLKLVSEVGRWATKDNSMIFGKVVWLLDEDDANRYHLIDESKTEIKVNVRDYIVEDGF